MIGYSTQVRGSFFSFDKHRIALVSDQIVNVLVVKFLRFLTQKRFFLLP